MVTEKDIEFLTRFSAGEHLVLSLYLNVDGHQVTREEYRSSAVSLAHQARTLLKERALSKTQEREVLQDIERFENYILNDFDRHGVRGLAYFACGPLNFLQIYRLPRPVNTQVVIDKDPYTKPLMGLLEDLKRYCVLLIDREKARIFSVYLGEIEEFTEVFDEVPPQVREGGWYGLEEKHIHRHIEDHVLHHLKHVAQVLFDEFHRRKFDRLILGGTPENLSLFQELLHPYLKERLVARIDLPVTAPVREVLEKSLEVDLQIEREEEWQKFERYREAEAHGLGVYRLKSVARAIAWNEADTILVEHGLAAPGIRCQDCGYLGPQEGEQCPLCGSSALEPKPEVVDEMLEEARQRGMTIEFFSPVGVLRAREGIAAILRYKPQVTPQTYS